MDRIYNLSLHSELISARRRESRGGFRQFHKNGRDLKKWKNNSTQELVGSPNVPVPPTAVVNMDSAKLGRRVILNDKILSSDVD